MNFNRITSTLLGFSVAAILTISVFSVIGVQEVDADGSKIWKFFKKFSNKADFVAKMNTEQIPDVHRLFDDRGNTGMAKFSFNDDMSKLEYTLKVEGLDIKGVLTTSDTSDDLTKIHFHQAAVGTPGPHVFNVVGAPCEPDNELSFLAATGTTTGAWDDNDDIREDVLCPPLATNPGPASESLTEKLEALCNGELYVNIHSTYAVTSAGDNGEIRGQIEPTKRGEKLCKQLGFD